MFRAGPVATAAALVLGALAAGCATARLAPAGDPAGSGGVFRPRDTEERALWDASRLEEERLERKCRLVQDDALDAWLVSIVRRLSAEDTDPVAWHVRVVDDTALNAFAYPDGALYVHTGLLARLVNEDQLAVVLAHEMAHVSERHLWRSTRAARDRSVALVALGVLAGGAGLPALAAARALPLVPAIGTGEFALGRAALRRASAGYGRSLEAAADASGLDRAVRAGFDPREAVRVYALLGTGHAVRRDGGPLAFASHPALARRMDDALRWTARHATGWTARPPRGEDPGFTRRVRALVVRDARLALDLDRRDEAADQVRRLLDADPSDPGARELEAQLGR